MQLVGRAARIHTAVLRRGLAVPRSESELLQRPVCPAVGPLDCFFQRKGMFKTAQRSFAFWLLSTQSGFSPSQQGAPWPLSPRSGVEVPAILPTAGWPPGVFCPSGNLASKPPPRTLWGLALHNCRQEPGSKAQGASVCRGPARAVAGMVPARRLCPWDVRRSGPLAPLPGGPSLPRDRGLQGHPKAALMSPRVHACAVFQGRPQAGEGDGRKTPTQQAPPPAALTFVAPVDAGDLDLLRGDVLLHELLALQPVPQGRLARVPVPSDNDLHCGERAQVRQTVKAKGKLSPPSESTHGFSCTDVASVAGEPGELGEAGWPGAPGGTRPWAHVRSLGAPAALLSPRPPTDFLRGRWSTSGLSTRERTAPELGARGAGRGRPCSPLQAPRFPRPLLPSFPRALASSGQDSAGRGAPQDHIWDDNRKPGFYSACSAGVQERVHVEGWGQRLPHWHRAPGRAGVDSMFLTRSSSRAPSSKCSTSGTKSSVTLYVLDLEVAAVRSPSSRILVLSF